MSIEGSIIGPPPGGGSSGGGAPSGAAGGELAGTYPNPTVKDGVIDDANIVAAGLTNAALSASAAIAASKLAAAAASHLAVFTTTGVVATGTGVIRYYFPIAATIINCSAAINTAPTGASLIVDVNKNGTTIYTTQANRPAISAAANAAAEGSAPDVTSLAAGDYLTVDIDQVGSTIAGSNLTVVVRYRWT